LPYCCGKLAQGLLPKSRTTTNFKRSLVAATQVLNAFLAIL
jgi:hypothetical protein